MTKKSKGGLWIFVFAAGATLGWVGFLGWAATRWSYTRIVWRIEQLHLLTLNEIGDFFAGSLTGFGIIGLLTTILLQRLDLQQTQEQFNTGQDATYKLQLFDRRFEVARQFSDALHHINSDGKPTTETRIKLADAMERGRYLFGKDFNDAADEVWERVSKWRRLNVTSATLSRKSKLTLAEASERQRVLDEIEDTDRWLWDRLKDGRFEEIFKKYLQMPEPRG
ncbi:hypothetical protein [Sinorhizobium meliloti]|uniref:Uncharacterized protein n=1 Tax=Rhizobium meliloti TaxID=382 RepID=A0A2J0Z0D5_RHIML|nr:hypothetical protein [Sinorhizobium meliloti]PJR13983.1 hypothetical protein CEJ86_19785 [Sinorhizobium meliloti]